MVGALKPFMTVADSCKSSITLLGDLAKAIFYKTLNPETLNPEP